VGELLISRPGKQDLQFLVQTINWKREPGNNSSPAHNSRFPEPLIGWGPRNPLAAIWAVSPTSNLLKNIKSLEKPT